MSIPKVATFTSLPLNMITILTNKYEWQRSISMSNIKKINSRRARRKARVGMVDGKGKEKANVRPGNILGSNKVRIFSTLLENASFSNPVHLSIVSMLPIT